MTGMCSKIPAACAKYCGAVSLSLVTVLNRMTHTRICAIDDLPWPVNYNEL
eukprot:COSAG01_NODE_7169_length_3320_cov_4.520646_4_plen_51_part_00